MALRTVGTNANNSLSAFVVGFNDTIAADLASVNVAIREDPTIFQAWNPVATTGLVDQTKTGTTRRRVNQAYTKQGLLVIPNRGIIQLKPGDVVAWDATTGWPIVLSGDAFANGPYTHS